jgi:hypothetical protein
MKMTRPDSTLERLLLALEDELLEATDEEVLAAARDLGMKPEMKASSAFFGLTMLVRPMIVRPGSPARTSDAGRIGSSRRRPKGETP